ncbi:MAG: helicase, partial [Bacteroidota bacterium]|nr:helicase [Bacteroidota bacterium]
TDNFRELAERLNISFLAVDEAHCISEWGHDFRPAYLKIPRAFERKENLQLMALTATATPEVQDDIISVLKMKAAQKFIRGFDRPNLSYISELTTDKEVRLAKLCRIHNDGSIIIYCGTRRRVEEFGQSLNERGITADVYHAGLDDNQRKMVQEKFIGDRSKVIVCTNAFGMGIDKPNVRKVIHCDYTQTLEAYYQEAGRGGRDGLPSDCILLHNQSDVRLQQFFIDMTYPSMKNIEIVYDTIYDSAGAKFGQKPNNPIYLNEIEIGNKANLSDKIVSSVLTLLEKYDIIKKNRTFSKAKIRIETSRERIVEYYQTTNPVNRLMLEALLRSVGNDVYYNDVDIDIDYIITKHNIDSAQFAKSLQSFDYGNLIRYQPAGTPGGISFLLERMPLKRLPVDFDDYKARRTRAEKKLEVVVRYANTHECKRNYILNYFQDPEIGGDCGRCSSCNQITKPRTIAVSLRKEDKSDIENALFAAAELNGRFGKGMLVDYLFGSQTRKIFDLGIDKGTKYGSIKGRGKKLIVSLIEQLIENNYLSLNSDLYPVIYLTNAGKEKLGSLPPPVKLKYGNNQSDKDPLYEKLKALREKLAGTEGVVPRGIMSDAALRSFCILKPLKFDDLDEIRGLSPFFIERFGKSFLQIVREHLAAEAPKPAEANKLPKELLPVIPLLKQRMSISNIAEHLSISIPDAAQLIQSAIENDCETDINSFIDNDSYNEIKLFLLKKPKATLRDVRNAVKSEASYPELRIGVAFARRELAYCKN